MKLSRKVTDGSRSINNDGANHQKVMFFSAGRREWKRDLKCSFFLPRSGSGIRAGIDKSLALERKIESGKRNFSLDLENLIVSISLSTLDFREW